MATVRFKNIVHHVRPELGVTYSRSLRAKISRRNSKPGVLDFGKADFSRIRSQKVPGAQDQTVARKTVKNRQNVERLL